MLSIACTSRLYCALQKCVSVMTTKNTFNPTVQQIAELCYNKFRNLPKTGKPINQQWTVLAGIVKYDRQTQSSTVVSLATGSVR